MDIQNQLEKLEGMLKEALAKVENLQDLEQCRIDFLGRKGLLAQLMSRLPELDPSQRPLFGQAANAVKLKLTELFDTHKNILDSAKDQEFLNRFDPTEPGRMPWSGSLHPITLAMEEVCQVFQSMGYEIVVGPEVDTDFNCFEALNMPPEHPARDMQDTFYVKEGLLRTHTSTLQVRTMLSRKPPLAIIAPGKVYRRDSDITHTPMFHQIEGLLVDTHVTMADLHGTLTAFLRALFGENTKVRFRPSFFPFTEPSVEVDISCTQCGGKGYAASKGESSNNESCRICKGTGWLEILGSGMLDPAVFESVGYDPNEVSGFAFGLGVERVAMLKYGITDLRMNFENDVRFLSQFSGI